MLLNAAHPIPKRKQFFALRSKTAVAEIEQVSSYTVVEFLHHVKRVDSKNLFPEHLANCTHHARGKVAHCQVRVPSKQDLDLL